MARSLDDQGKISAGYFPGSFSRILLAPHQMQERFTPTEDLFVLCHLGVPQLEAASWSLTIDGLVAQPLRLGFSDLTAYPKCTITSFHQCCGNPLRPSDPARRISNVRCSGARLAAYELWGWAWGDCEIDRVDVSIDGDFRDDAISARA